MDLSKYIDDSIHYDNYRELVTTLFERGLSTGPNQSEALLAYTRLNESRMNRLDKTVQLNDKTIKTLNSLDGEKWIWLVISEGWCGDAAQNLPVISKIAEQSPNIELKIVFRDENLDLIDQFLTNGGRSIPKLIAIRKEDLEVIGTWGPRPEPVQKLMLDFRANPGNKTNEDLKKDIHTWYAKDKSQTVQEELIQLIEASKEASVGQEA
ncbi:MAG: thioredoxin family protein [Bacteroidota bacterium]